MRTVLCALVAVGLLGCGGSSTETAPSPEQTPLVAPEPPSPVKCPEGASAKMEQTPQGPEYYCAKDGIKNGPFERHYGSGKRAVQGAYANGEPDGPWFWFHENGEKSQKGSYKAGKPVGSWTWWYENGNPKEEGDYLNGRKVGQWVLYYESGRKSEEGLFQNDLKNGTWTFYADDEANAVSKTEKWASGQLEGTADPKKK